MKILIACEESQAICIAFRDRGHAAYSCDIQPCSGGHQYNQIIQPYEYGHPFQKKTCLWLRGLPKLQPTNIITGDVISWVSGGTKDNKGLPRKNKGTTFRNSVIRSKTFKGIAAAMAEQWVF